MRIKVLLFLILSSYGYTQAQSSEFYLNIGHAAPIRSGDMGTVGIGLRIPSAIEIINFQMGMNMFQSLKNPPIGDLPKESFSNFYMQLGVNIIEKRPIEMSLLFGFHLRGRLVEEPTVTSSYFGPYFSTFLKLRLSNHVGLGVWGTIGTANDIVISEARFGLLFQ